MARMIDGDKLVENLRLIATCWSISPFVSKEKHNGAVDMLREVEREVKEAPTLTPPDEPLPVLVNDEPGREYIDYICPRCRDIISQRRRGQRAETVYQCKYHDNCGQHVDWSNPRPYRRPPERQEGT